MVCSSSTQCLGIIDVRRCLVIHLECRILQSCCVPLILQTSSPLLTFRLIMLRSLWKGSPTAVQMTWSLP